MKKIFLGCKYLIALWVLASAPLTVMTTGYIMEVPVLKYFFTVFNSMDGWGIETVFEALGLGILFYFVKDRQKKPWVSGLSTFFAICTVLGISYEKTNSWNCIFLYKTQFILAIIVTVGYYLLYKNCTLFVILLIEKIFFSKTAPRESRLECFLFQKHTLLGPFLFLFLLDLPWFIFFCPGTLHWDALNQLEKSFGILPINTHHPILISEYMKFCICLGRTLMHSDSFGFFLYTGPQFICQLLVFAYSSHVMSKLSVPLPIRWGALFYWGLHPLLPIWGYTMAKDSLYYISFSLLTAVILEICGSKEKIVKKHQILFFLIGITGLTMSRNEGRYVVVFMVVCGLLLYRKYWKLFLSGAFLCVMLVAGEQQYIAYHQIPNGEIGEMLSIPLQQTARYLNEHPDDMTERETQILNEVFTAPLDQIAAAYNPVLSDPVKASFIAHPDRESLQNYFTVWFHQLLRHPDTYIQAFFNHIYGYFYPNKHNWGGKYFAAFYLADAQYLQHDYLNIRFLIRYENIRQILEHYVYLTEKIPVLSLLLSSGAYVYAFLTAFVYLFVKKERRTLMVLLPGVCVLLICLFSPVNGYLRYLLPIIATMPVFIGWCFTAEDRTAH